MHIEDILEIIKEYEIKIGICDEVLLDLSNKKHKCKDNITLLDNNIKDSMQRTQKIAYLQFINKLQKLVIK